MHIERDRVYIVGNYMSSRQRILWFIFATWLVLTCIIFVAAHNLLSSGLNKLEYNLASENSNRVYDSMLINLESIQKIALGLTDNTLVFTVTPYEREEYAAYIAIPEVFNDNKVEVLLLQDQNLKIIYSRYFNLASKEFENINPDLKKIITKALLSKHSRSIIKSSAGKSFFLQTKDGETWFVTSQPVYSSMLSQKIGHIILAKHLTRSFFKTLSEQLSYQTFKLPLSLSSQISNKNIIQKLNTNKKIVVSEIDSSLLASYRYIYDFKNRPLAVLRVDQPRHLHQQSRASLIKSLIVLAIYSFIAVIALMILVFIFFKSQERFTIAFERFVPHKLVSLLNKKVY